MAIYLRQSDIDTLIYFAIRNLKNKVINLQIFFIWRMCKRKMEMFATLPKMFLEKTFHELL